MGCPTALLTCQISRWTTLLFTSSLASTATTCLRRLGERGRALILVLRWLIRNVTIWSGFWIKKSSKRRTFRYLCTLFGNNYKAICLFRRITWGVLRGSPWFPWELWCSWGCLSCLYSRGTEYFICIFICNGTNFTSSN